MNQSISRAVGVLGAGRHSARNFQSGSAFSAESILLFVVGCTRYLDVALLGRVSVSELVMFSALPFLLGSLQRVVNTKVFKRYAAFLLLALISITISDWLINQVRVQLYLKTLARFGFATLIGLFWGAVLAKRFDLLTPFLWGSLVGAVVNLFRVSEFDREGAEIGVMGYNFWLTKGSPLVAAIVMLASVYLFKRSKLVVIIIFLVASVFVGVTAGRVRAAIFLVTACSVAIVWWYTARSGRKGELIGRAALWKVAAAMIVFVSICYFLYIFAAPAGLLGERQRVKFEFQSGTTLGATPWGILLGGRVDFLQSALVVLDNPLWGVGSWSIPKHYFIDAYTELGLQIPRYQLAVVMSDDASAGHSMMMGAWATGGVLTVPFFLFALYLCVRVVVLAFTRPSQFTPLLISSSFTLMFAIFFNPFSLSNRNTLGLIVGVMAAFELVNSNFSGRGYLPSKQKKVLRNR